MKIFSSLFFLALTVSAQIVQPGAGGGGGATASTSLTDSANLVRNNASNTFSTGTQDLSGAAHTLPALKGLAASKPATCTQGEQYFATNATAGQNLYFCTATNTWTQQTAGATSAAFPLTIVQEGSAANTAGSNVTSFLFTFPSALAASGNTAFILISCDGSNTVTGPAGWTTDINSQQATYARVMLLHKTTAGETSATFTVAAASSFAAYLIEVSGSHAVDQIATLGTANSNFAILPAITPTAGSVVIGMAGFAYGGGGAPYMFAPDCLDPNWRTMSGVIASVGGGSRLLLIRYSTKSATNVSTQPPLFSLADSTQFGGSGIAMATFSIL